MINQVTIYKKDLGWVEVLLTEVENYNLTMGSQKKSYKVCKDPEGNLYWIILGQKVEPTIASNNEMLEKILDYSQQDNWIVETYLLKDNYTVTKYYPDSAPLVITSMFKDLYSAEVRHEFTESYKKFFTAEKRKKFHLEATNQHEMFSEYTGCYFHDIQPNNFLASPNFKDIKIIDVCSLSVGNIPSDYKDPFPDNPHSEWPLKSYRTVGPNPWV
tara:strand:- start:1 stop:645 length:645 start_codon:yes stop_codon:yes gene_type:complete